MHGPPDSAGRCPWCRNQIETTQPAPRAYPRSELSEAYAYVYDPDEGAKGRLEREREVRAGLTNY
jgi:hypothetical protein